MSDQEQEGQALTTAEFSRMFDRRGIREQAEKLNANEAERAALAKRFLFVSIAQLEAELSLSAKGKDITAQGTMRARFVHSCAVSGEDLPGEIEQEIKVRFVPAADWSDESSDEIELEEEELDALPYSGTRFDLGEAVAQSLALAIDPFATGPNADTARERSGIVDEDTPSGPLQDALAGLNLS